MPRGCAVLQEARLAKGYELSLHLSAHCVREEQTALAPLILGHLQDLMSVHAWCPMRQVCWTCVQAEEALVEAMMSSMEGAMAERAMAYAAAPAPLGGILGDYEGSLVRPVIPVAGPPREEGPVHAPEVQGMCALDSGLYCKKYGCRDCPLQRNSAVAGCTPPTAVM